MVQTPENNNRRPAAVSASRAVCAIRYRRRTVTRRTSSGASLPVPASLLRRAFTSCAPVEQVPSVGRLRRRPRRQALFEHGARRPSGSWLAAPTPIGNSVRETDPEGEARSASSAGVVVVAAHLTPNEPTREQTARGATPAAGACVGRACCGWPRGRAGRGPCASALPVSCTPTRDRRRQLTNAPERARRQEVGAEYLEALTDPPTGARRDLIPLPPTGRAAFSPSVSTSSPCFSPSVAAECRSGLNPVHSRGFERPIPRSGETFRAYGDRAPPKIAPERLQCL